MWPLLTGTQRYEKVVSTRNRGHGEFIDAPILAYLIETPNGRILYCKVHVHVHGEEIKAAATQLDGGVFDDEVAGAGQWKVQDGDYLVAPGVRAIETPGHTAGHMSLFIELPKGQPVILCGDAADLRENLIDEIAPGYCWQDNESLALASIRRLNALSRSESAQLWPNHDFDAYRSWVAFPAWRD